MIIRDEKKCLKMAIDPFDLGGRIGGIVVVLLLCYFGLKSSGMFKKIKEMEKDGQV